MSEYRLGYQVRITSAKSYTFGVNWAYLFIASSFGKQFSGTGCDFGNSAFNPAYAPFTCNNKVLAAKSYGLGYHNGTGEGLVPGSYLSARDESGHGTHTATTAAGNAGVTASILGSNFGAVTGIAPRARISVYKACWEGVPAGCASSDLAAAIEIGRAHV